MRPDSACTAPAGVPVLSAPEPLLQVSHLSLTFRQGRHAGIRALQDLSFAVQQGEILALAGESGCGKSTLGRCLCGLLQPDAGRICLHGIQVSDRAQYKKHRKEICRQVQLIFQGQEAVDPQLSLYEVISEPLQALHLCSSRQDMLEQVRRLCSLTELDERLLHTPAAALSGGQLQRAALARALTVQPALLIADELTAAQDVLLQARLIELLQQLRHRQHMAVIFITHDLPLAHYFADSIAVMLAGRIVEKAPAAELMEHPLHPYTQELLRAQLPPDPAAARALLLSEPPVRQPLPERGSLQEVSPWHLLYLPA